MSAHEMNGKQFRKWRKGRKLSQKKAAELLGLKPRMIQYYEKGKSDGKDFKILKTTELACYAVSVGIEHYFGPASLSAKDQSPHSRIKFTNCFGFTPSHRRIKVPTSR